jgi:hypothetical protein
LSNRETKENILDFARGNVFEWTFDCNSDREGWSVPRRLTGAVMGGALWLTPTPREQDPVVLSSLNYQIYGDYDAVTRILAGEPAKRDGPSPSGELSIAGPSTVDIVSPGGLQLASPSPGRQLQAHIRVLNLSAATNLDLKWRSTADPPGSWQWRRCALQPDLKRWQQLTCYFAPDLPPTIDQIALGLSENLIRGDLWIDSIELRAGDPRPAPVRPDIAGSAVVPRISVPGLTPRHLARAFEVLDDNLIVDVPAYGFPYPYIRPSGDAKYGEYWFYVDGSLGAEAAAWVNQSFAEDVMRGVRVLQNFNPDGRFVGTPWEPITGQVGDITNGGPLFYFESAYAIATRSHDPALRSTVLDTMRGFLEWYLSPIKRDAATGLITGTHEEVLFPVSNDDITGFQYVQTRAPVSLNVATAVSAHLAAGLAEAMGREQEARRYRQVVTELRQAINEVLWDSEEGAYYDYDLKHGRHIRMLTAATFFPLRLAIAPPERRRRLLRLMRDPDRFNMGRHPIPNVALAEQAKEYRIWALTNVPVIKGLLESGETAMAAELNWQLLRLFQSNSFTEFYTLMGEGYGGERYAFTAAGYITGVIERLFGLRYDALNRTVHIAPLLPRALNGESLAIENVILPTGAGTRVSVSLKAMAAGALKVTVAFSGELPDGRLQLQLPGRPAVEVPVQRQFSTVLRGR